MAVHLADPDHNSSFTKGVFLGEIRESLVFPFPELAHEEKESLCGDPRLVPLVGRRTTSTPPSRTTTGASRTTCAPGWPSSG